MKIRDILESKNSLNAIFVLGPPSQGKSTIADSVIEHEYQYTLLDIDRPSDLIRKKYNISDIISAPSEEDKQKVSMHQKVKQRFKKYLSTDDLIDEKYFNKILRSIKNELNPPKELIKKYIDLYTPFINKSGNKILELTKEKGMIDYSDPEEYIKTIDKNKLGPHHAMIVGKEVIRREYDRVLGKKNVVFVETGGNGGYQKRIQELNNAGYNVYCIYVGIHPELDLNNKNNLNKILKITVERQKQRERQLDVNIIKSALLVSQKTKDTVLPLFDNVEYIDTGKYNTEQAKQVARNIMKGWGL